MKKKFADDIDAALAVNPDLYGFVFFTNVDVTPADEAELKKRGLGLGVSHIEIVGRENMRLYLDSPTGLSTRYQFLNITMSDEEQKVFFQTYGAKLENVILNRFGYIESRLERIEFLQDSTHPIDRIGMVLIFSRPVSAREIADAAIRLNIYVDLRHWSKDYGKDHARMLWVATKTRADPQRPNFVAFDNYLWTTTFDGGDLATIDCAHPEWREDPKLESIDLFSYHVRGRLPFTGLLDLDRRGVTAEITKNLLDKLANIWLVVGDYIVCKIDVSPDTPTTEEEFITVVEKTGMAHINAFRQVASVRLKELWPNEDQPQNWVKLAGDGHWRSPEINFESYRPERLEKYLITD
ncbi:MAG TPA: hypothetical protein VKI44_26790 [Acetobacteraceae bacterium]|nr:hypothetical protein [Acetobacteraceae bacterium]